MKLQCLKYFLGLSLIVSASAAHTSEAIRYEEGRFSSDAGTENQVSYQAIFRTDFTTLASVQQMTESQKRQFLRGQVMPTVQFLFGPLTHRNMGGAQKGPAVNMQWEGAYLKNGRVEVPYNYSGLWIMDKALAAQGQFELPIPYNTKDIYTSKWKSCSDWDPEHQTPSFFWYFWDPTRWGCDHVEGQQYQTVKVTVGLATLNQTETFPEYEKLLRSAGLDKNLQITFGFGYVKDPANPYPEKDQDAGMWEYRQFVSRVRSMVGPSFQDIPILEKEYLTAIYPEKIIGHRFVGQQNGVRVTINVVAAADIDQMDIFAKSFAHDHDGFFGWLGHSRVGSGFDAQAFGEMVAENPEYFKVTTDYQLVYWGGCNSYSYYTLPFFDFKAAVSGGTDPKGTKGLDIIANGLPSLFSLNEANASTILTALLNWESRPSYQKILSAIEADAKQTGVLVLAAVLGDEDNK